MEGPLRPQQDGREPIFQLPLHVHSGGWNASYDKPLECLERIPELAPLLDESTPVLFAAADAHVLFAKDA